MPVVVSVDREHRLASRVYSGVVTSSDLLDSLKQYPTLPGFEPSFNELMDFRNAESVVAPAEDIQRCAHSPTPFSPETKRVIVAPRELIYGLARMYQILGEDVHPNVFVVKTMEEARKILGEAAGVPSEG